MRATAQLSVKAHAGIPKKTPLILLLALSNLLWSICTPLDRTFAARALLLQPLWIARAVLKDETWPQDLGLTLVLHALYCSWTGVWSLPDNFNRLHLDDVTLRLYASMFSLLSFCGLFAGLIMYRGGHLEAAKERSNESNERIKEHLLPPLLLPSRTTHSRMFPRKHAFSYSYLFVGVPVGFRGRVRSALSVDVEQRGWFHVQAADYLNRGDPDMDVAEKLKAYLHTQGVTDRDYAFAYLVTAPRFLGYSFNPVSFWYLYDSDTRLKYMVLEVNNTFDERRLYLLKAGDCTTGSGVEPTDDAEVGSAESPKRLMFTDTWAKDFHVSPFNSRKGSYSLRAVDPLAAWQENGQVCVDNTIVLSSSKEHAKIVARVYLEGAPQDPQKITRLQLARFIGAWWWVGLITFPRIVWQARKLYFTKNLNVWFRPEVTASSIGRSYTCDESVLEVFFRAFMTRAVDCISKPIRVVYRPAHSTADIVLYSSNFTYEEDHERTLTITILSPAFYSRFVHYSHANEAFDCECLATDENNRTAIVETPSLLPTLLNSMQEACEVRGGARKGRDPLEQVRWSWLRRLRCPPAAVAYPDKAASKESSMCTISDIQQLPLSELDCFVRRTCSDSSTYRRIATKLFLAERLALGLPILMVASDWFIRSMCIFTAILYCDGADAYDVFQPRNVDKHVLGTTVLALWLANAVHLWGFVKG